MNSMYGIAGHMVENGVKTYIPNKLLQYVNAEFIWKYLLVLTKGELPIFGGLDKGLFLLSTESLDSLLEEMSTHNLAAASKEILSEGTGIFSSIDALHLSPYIALQLHTAGIDKIVHLMYTNHEVLYTIPDIGDGSILIIRAAVDYYFRDPVLEEMKLKQVEDGFRRKYAEEAHLRLMKEEIRKMYSWDNMVGFKIENVRNGHSGKPLTLLVKKNIDGEMFFYRINFDPKVDGEYYQTKLTTNPIIVMYTGILITLPKDFSLPPKFAIRDNKRIVLNGLISDYELDELRNEFDRAEVFKVSVKL